MISAPRLLYSLAEQGQLPKWFGHIHDKYGTPAHAILVMGGLALAFALTSNFVELAIASSLSRLLAWQRRARSWRHGRETRALRALLEETR